MALSIVLLTGYAFLHCGRQVLPRRSAFYFPLRSDRGIKMKTTGAVTLYSALFGAFRWYGVVERIQQRRGYVFSIPVRLTPVCWLAHTFAAGAGNHGLQFFNLRTADADGDPDRRKTREFRRSLLPPAGRAAWAFHPERL